MSGCLDPKIGYHDDELSQGFFARLGNFHAGVSANRFCSFVDMDRVAFRNGSDRFIDLTAGLSGVEREKLDYNTVRLLDDGTFLLRGEKLGMSVLRRTQVQYCPKCLQSDRNQTGCDGAGIFRQKWIWQLRPVTTCPVHRVPLVAIKARYGVDAFDLEKLLEPYGIIIDAPSVSQAPGVLQKYVTDRMSGAVNLSAWLDSQGIAEGVRACKMIGSLLVDGPQATIKDYSTMDWAAVGDVGFEVCSEGPEAIKKALQLVRINSGRTSGRTGPQAVFGQLYNSIKKTEREGGLGPIVDVVRDAIVENFAIGAGETVLGVVIPQRKVHSVCSLAAATKTQRYRLYRVARTMGMIPATADLRAFNQCVFPAKEAEKLIAQIENSVPQKSVMGVLGCTITQVDHLVRNDFIRSITPISEGKVGQMYGNFNRDELSKFLNRFCEDIPVIPSEIKDYISLSNASKMRTNTGQVVRWFLDGKLPKTRLLNGKKRLDHIRFCRSEVLGLIQDANDHDFHRLFVVSQMLGASLTAIKRLTSTENGGPWLKPVGPEESKMLAGSTYVSGAEIERFKSKYLTPGLIGRMFGIHFAATLRILKANEIDPVHDPKELGACIYRRRDVVSVAPYLEAATTGSTCCRTGSLKARSTIKFEGNNRKMGEFGESDASI